jgi:uncharacterized surface protein with fasciclin (FAS1) repeats
MLKLSSQTKLLASTVALFGVISAPAAMAGSYSSSDKQSAQESQVIAAESKETVVDIAASADSFKILTAALKAAELVDALQGEGPFTVFAPTDEAFNALPEGTLAKLLKPENKDRLVKILTYHVIPGAVTSADLKSGKVATLEGSEVTIVLGDSVEIDDAQVVQSDVKASNGVIHVIDKVIVPSD